MLVVQISTDTFRVQPEYGKPVGGTYIVRNGVCSCQVSGCAHSAAVRNPRANGNIFFGLTIPPRKEGK